MVSRGNVQIARYAIDCFLRQTYSNRELIVVSDSSSAEFWDYLRPLEQDKVRAIKVSGTPLLGELRNISVSEARGPLICQWDDDDLHDPARLSRGVQVLSATNAAAAFLVSWMVWWPSRRLLAVSKYRIWEGSIIARREILPAYPNFARSEDRVLVSELKAIHQIVLMDDPRLYCYTITGVNTFGEKHFERLIANARDVYCDSAYQNELDTLAKRTPILTYAAALDTLRPRVGFRNYSLGDAANRRATLQLACSYCGRSGRHRMDRLLAQFGPDIALHDLRERLARCPYHGLDFQPCQVDYVDPLDA
jgi:glycosyltransferase involved in cell wall biosynthesis